MSDETTVAEDVPALVAEQPAAGVFATPGFGQALDDADILLGYAASTGQLPLGMAGETVNDIVHARQAWQNNQVTARVAIAFWIAYANLARVTKPVTAASLRACEAASLSGEKIRATILVLIIIAFSVFLFMNNTTATETADLIDQQNAAALKLWGDLQVLRSSIAEQTAASSPSPSAAESQSSAAFVNRVFEDTVEFSRRSQWLLQSASKLHFWFNPWWTNIDIKSVTYDKDNPNGITHLLISPATSRPNEVQDEVENQIKAYQFIRN